VDLSTSTTEILVVVEAFPQSEQGLGAGLCTGIEQNADFGVQDAANGGEQPSVRVDLLAVLLLQAEHHLDGRERAGAVIVGANELLVGRDGELRGVLELRLLAWPLDCRFCSTHDMGNGLVSVNVLLHDTILVYTDSREQVERALVAGVDTVEDEAHDNLLPSRAALVPELGLLQVDNVADVLHDTVQGAGGEDLVFVVVGDGDEQLRVAVVHGRAQIVAVLEGEVVGVARRGRVWHLSESRVEAKNAVLTAHVRKLLATALEVIAVLRLDGVLDGRRHGVVGAENRALDELDLAGHAALEAARRCHRAARLLSLSPCLGRARLAALVWRRGALGTAKLRRRVVAARRRVDI
jgi:hypothetical protein